MGGGRYKGYRPSAKGYQANMRSQADTYLKSGLLGGAAMTALGKYAYDKMFKKPVNVTKAAMGNNTTRAMKNRTRPSGPRRRKNVPLKGDKGQGGYAQWTQRYQQATFGKLTPKKIDKLSNDTVVYRHQLIGPFNDYGQRFMYNGADGTGNQFYPLILFELNSTNNYVSGTQTYMSPVHQMNQPSGTTNIGWNPLTGQSPDGTNTLSQWQLEKSGHTTTAVPSHPMEQSILKWSSIDLELWGQTAKPTMYSVYLCQFNEDVLPGTTFSANVGTYSTITDQSACQFWQSMVKRFTYSPLAKVEDGWGNKKMKILKQYKINIDPTSTTESDPDPHVKTLKLFYRFNRKCDFSWKFSAPGTQTIANMNDSDWNQETGENQCQVHPNARLFLMVRASNFQRTLAASATNANTPSISWVMKSCHLINQ